MNECVHVHVHACVCTNPVAVVCNVLPVGTMWSGLSWHVLSWYLMYIHIILWMYTTRSVVTIPLACGYQSKKKPVSKPV